MPDTGLVLAFYRDAKAAQKTLESLRQNGFRRTATLQHQADKKNSLDRGGLPPGSAALFGGISGLLLSRFVPLPASLRAANSLVTARFGRPRRRWNRPFSRGAT